MPARAHQGIALTALGAILAVTVAWWTLALYPAGAASPEWLIRTRMACFGAGPGGLPNAGGWILLIGEPVGMAAVLAVVWRQALWDDLRVLWSCGWGRAVMVAIAGSLLWGGVAATDVVRRVSGRGADNGVAALSGLATRVAMTTPPLALTDQHGALFDLRSLEGRPVVVTFAFAHCETVCPTLVREVKRARQQAQREDIPLVIVTVDPWRDVPSRLSAIASTWDLAPNDRVLSGSIQSVNHVLDRWSVGRSRSETTGNVSHAAVVVLVSGDARRAWRMDGGWDGLAEMLRRML